jgi:hypothetical protein
MGLNCIWGMDVCPRYAYPPQAVKFQQSAKSITEVCLVLVRCRQKDNAEIAHREQELWKYKLAQK